MCAMELGNGVKVCLTDPCYSYITSGCVEALQMHKTHTGLSKFMFTTKLNGCTSEKVPNLSREVSSEIMQMQYQHS